MQVMYFTIICYKTFFSKYTISSFSIRLCLHVFFIRNRNPFLSKIYLNMYINLKKISLCIKVYQRQCCVAMRKFPKDILFNYEKTGFYSPFRSFFKKDFIKIRKYLLNSKILRKNLNIRSFHKLLKNLIFF